MSASQKSLVSIWITCGFSLGIGFGWLVFQDEKPKTYVAPPFAVKATPVPRHAAPLTELEADFQRWGGYAVWEDDLTEIALLNPETKRHTDYYEVRRAGGEFYFRSIGRLSRPLIDHGPRGALHFAFTEPQWMRDQFYRDHPRYDLSAERIVTLPPRPPERFSPEGARPRRMTPRSALTPGAGILLPSHP